MNYSAKSNLGFFGLTVSSWSNSQNAPPCKKVFISRWWNKKMAACGIASPPGDNNGISKQFACV